MSKITTEICKDFLVSHYKNIGIDTKESNWKRVSKYKINDDWIRQFSNEKLGVVSLIEKNDKLEFFENESFIEIEKKSYFKTFSKEEIKTVKSLIKKLIKVRENDNEEEEEELFNDKNWNLCKSAIPSQFTFYFPEETYMNIEENKTNGLNSPMLVKIEYPNEFIFKSLNVIFEDKNTDDIDLYTNDVLISQKILPEWLDPDDEYSISICYYLLSDDKKKLFESMTVKDFINYLFEMGFEYKVGELGCMFEEEITSYLTSSPT